MDAIGIKEFEHYGHGVSALRDIEEGDSIVKVPRKLMITSDTIMESPLSEYQVKTTPLNEVFMCKQEGVVLISSPRKTFLMIWFNVFA